jgi:hypothetical protein
MAEPTRPAPVALLTYRSDDAVRILEELLEKAKTGEVRAVAVAYEYADGATGHQAAFGKFANRTLMVGKLQVMAQHIVLNECLEWKPE